MTPRSAVVVRGALPAVAPASAPANQFGAQHATVTGGDNELIDLDGDGGNGMIDPCSLGGNDVIDVSPTPPQWI